MEHLPNYLINEKTVLLTGEYDDSGKLCTLVIEGENMLLVDLQPTEVINRTLLQLGSNFEAARESSKVILGNNIKYHPIKVNRELGIWLFPTKSFNDPHCVWFSLIHIQNRNANGVKKTKIHLSYHHTIELHMKKYSFEMKLYHAKELREIMTKNNNSPFVFYIEPKKGFQIKEAPGRNPYNLHT